MKKRSFIALLVVSSALQFIFSPQAFAGAAISVMSQGQIEELLSQHSAGSYSVPAAAAGISSLFLDMPYAKSPLGEGKGNEPDEDPLWSFETVDCQTFLEEVIALAVSSSFEEFKIRINDIRYSDGKPSFISRNHLPEVQWLPNNVKKGYLRDITREIGGKDARIHRRELKPGKPVIYIEGRELPAVVIPGGAIETAYIPTSEAPKYIKNIPAGSIINIVRVENPAKAYMVTHQGLVIVKIENGREMLYLRHASRHFNGKVSDTSLYQYLKFMEGYENWPALGISIFLPMKPGVKK